MFWQIPEITFGHVLTIWHNTGSAEKIQLPHFLSPGVEPTEPLAIETNFLNSWV